MKRLSVAFIVAAALHLAVSRFEFNWHRPTPVPLKPITIELNSLPAPPTLMPLKPPPTEMIRPPQPKPAPRPAPPMPKPKPRPKTPPPPKPVPMPPKAVTKPEPLPSIPEPEPPPSPAEPISKKKIVTQPETVPEQAPIPKRPEPKPPVSTAEMALSKTTPDPAPPVSPVAKLPSQAPKYRQTVSPVYPRLAKRREQTGTVLLNVHVSRSGKVLELKIHQSSGHRLLDKSALKTVTTWQFEPALEEGHPVDQWVRVPIEFKLE